MDNIWDRKSFEVGGHCPLWREWKKRMTKQNRQSRTLKNKKQNPNKTGLEIQLIRLKQMTSAVYFCHESN